MIIHTPYTVPVTRRDVLSFFKLPRICGVTYWRYAVENIDRGAAGWREYFATVSNDGPGMILYFPLTLTPAITPVLNLSVPAIYMGEDINCMQFLLPMFLGSESCLSSTEILVSGFPTRNIWDFPLLHFSQSLQSRRSAKCTNFANSSCSNSAIFRRKSSHSGFILFSYLYR